MKRKETVPVFKPYVMDQMALLPASYNEVIPEGHLARVVNDAVEKIDLSALLEQYKGGGRSSYHPKMMLKILVYAYAEKVYSSRRIAKALRENIHYMWISGGNRPDFRTINDFRGSRMKTVIEEANEAEQAEYGEEDLEELPIQKWLGRFRSAYQQQTAALLNKLITGKCCKGALQSPARQGQEPGVVTGTKPVQISTIKFLRSLFAGGIKPFVMDWVKKVMSD